MSSPRERQLRSGDRAFGKDGLKPRTRCARVLVSRRTGGSNSHLAEHVPQEPHFSKPGELLQAIDECAS